MTAATAPRAALELEAGRARREPTWSDRSSCGRLVVRGADRVSFLHGQCSSDVKALTPGAGQATTFLTAKGKLRGTGVLYAFADRFLLATGPGVAAGLRRHLEGFVVVEDVTFEDAGDSLAELLVHGPGAVAAAGRALGAGLPATLPLHHHVTLAFAGGEVVVAAERPTGEEGVALFVPAAAGAALREALAARLPETGPGALEVLRIEAGIPRFGVDADEDTIPVEVGLHDAISYTKGCFTGAEVLTRIKTQGHVNRLLAGLVAPAGRPLASGATVRFEGKPVGRVTSACLSPALGRPIGLALLRREAAAAGLPVEVGEGEQAVAAEVRDLPFVEGAR